MNREQLTAFIAEQYSAEAEHPWIPYPNHTVFRHQNNQKWFALLMRIPKSKLGLDGDEPVDVLNLKCDPMLIGSLREEPGIYPAYHMSKKTWISIALDGGLPEEKLKWLLDLSYELTMTKGKRK